MYIGAYPYLGQYPVNKKINTIEAVLGLYKTKGQKFN